MKILKIGAIWCPECIIMRPRWLEIQKRFPDLVLEDINVDQNPEAKEKYNAHKIPVYIFYNPAGEEILRLGGLLEVEELAEHIKKFLLISKFKYQSSNQIQSSNE